jgi:hypothetical protein
MGYSSNKKGFICISEAMSVLKQPALFFQRLFPAYYTPIANRAVMRSKAQ